MTLLDAGAWGGRIYTDGWSTAAGSKAVTEPATGDELGSVGLAGPADIDRAVRRAAEAQPGWAATNFEERAAVLRRAGTLWEEHAKEVEDWLVREAGSIPPKAQVETHVAAQECYEAAALASHTLGQILPTARPRLSLARRRPVGVVGVIAPFNYPLILSIRSVAPALALGNSVVLKPDPRTAVSGGVTLAGIFEEAGLPPGLLHVLPGGPDVGTALVEHPGVPVISFTGSSAAGRKVGEACGRLLKRSLLELGGNSALIVLDDADLDLAVNLAAEGSYRNSGQRCTAVKRVLVQETIADEFTRLLLEKTREYTCGDPLDEGTRVGTVIDEPAANYLETVVQEAVAAGAKVLIGGMRKGALFQPTVIANVPRDCRMVTSESFGPLAPVITVKDLDDAVTLANSTEFGLSSGVVTRSLDKATECMKRLRCGTVNINEVPGYRIENSPFGGVKDSGLGIKEGVIEAIKCFTFVKTVSLPW